LEEDRARDGNGSLGFDFLRGQLKSAQGVDSGLALYSLDSGSVQRNATILSPSLDPIRTTMAAYAKQLQKTAVPASSLPVLGSKSSSVVQTPVK